MANEIEEVRYQVGEAWKGEYNAATPYGVAAVVQDPTGLSVYRSLKNGNTGHPLTDTNWWFCIIDMSSIKAASDDVDALNTEVSEDEAARVSAETGRALAENDRVAAESGRVTAENGRVSAESGRVTTESARVSAESARASAESSRATAESARVSAENARVLAENLRDNAESSRATAETNRAAAESERHTQSTADHNTAVSDHTTAQLDHTTAVADHEQATADHTASVEATAEASNVNAEIDGLVVTITDRNGQSHSVNIGFDIAGTYGSVAAMNADAANVQEGAFVMIATSDPTSAENARLYVRNSTAPTSSEPFTFLSDLDQASSSAWADWMENYKPTIIADHTRAEADHTTAAADHTAAVSDHNTATTDHTQAASDHSTAASDHTAAASDHTRAESDHTTAAADHTQAESDHQRAETDHSTMESRISHLEETSEGLLDGSIPAGLSENIQSWDGRSKNPIDSESKSLIRTTGGDESIDTDGGATLLAVACVGKDFTPLRLISSGRNLLRLQSNNGLAVAVGAGWYFPVPKLTATNDSIGTANENNGVLFTDVNGNNLTPTVYFKALGGGVPTSVTDGVVATYLDKNGRRHYTTPSEGYLIVSGITYANTCAHVAWSMGYDVFTSPTDVNDAGTIVSLSALGTLRSVGSGFSMVSDHADRTGDNSMLLTTVVGTSSNLTWTNAEDVDGEGQPTGTYTHTATINAMLANSVADIKVNGASVFVPLTVDGNTVSFKDANDTVASGYVVKYRLATPSTSSKSVVTKFAKINDFGIEYVDGTGEGQGVWQYVQGIPDAIYGLLGKRTMDNEVIAQTFAQVKSEIDGNKAQMFGYGTNVQFGELDAIERKTYGKPMFLKARVEGAPSESIIPENWDESKYGAWTGVPLAPNMFYTDMVNKKVYFAPECTNSVSDWILLN